MFLHVQSIQTLKMDNPFFFFKRLSFLPNVHHSFFKLEMILTLIIRWAKRLELIRKIITDLGTFGSEMFLTLKIWIEKICF